MKRYIDILLYLCIAILFLSVVISRQEFPLYKDSQVMMGTFVQVISPNKQAADIVFKEISRIEHLLSIFKEDSEISRLNKQGRLRVTPDTLFVIKKAGEFWEATGGAFDITVAPLLRLWGFYDKAQRVPLDRKIKNTLRLIGFDKLRINDNIIEFKTKGTEIDLGGIAKGFAVDCAVNKLRQAGIESAVVNAGGDIYCLGDKRGKPWRIAVKKAKSQDIAGYLELKDKAVATSGNYEQYFVINNLRYGHILNPKTGRPADSGVVSVTVIADNCLLADALATSIFVLGEVRGEELTKRFNSRAIIYTNVQNN